MSNAEKDQNGVSSLIAVSSSDGSTIVPLYADPTSHRLLVSASGGGGGGATGPTGPTGPTGTTGVTGPTGSPTPRVASTTSSATPTPNADTTDLFELTLQTATAAFQAPAGTPVDGQKLMFQIYSATAQALTFSATGYTAGVAALPTATVTAKYYFIGFQYVTANSLNKWMSIAQFSQN